MIFCQYINVKANILVSLKFLLIIKMQIHISLRLINAGVFYSEDDRRSQFF